MAFGDALRPNDGATVVLNVDTSQTAKLEQAEAQWRESVGQMSREALKLDLAQDRLRQSLAKYGAESAQAKRATIALKEAEEAAARAADRQARETRELERANRGAGTSMAALRRNVLGLAAAYVGVHGLVMGIRSSIEAAKEEQLVQGQTRIAVQAAGLEYERYAERINTVIRAQSQLGFDDEALMQTFQMFVRSTKDVNRALELNALAIDVARGRYIDLEQAAQIVNKANLGMAGALRRIGLDVEKTADRTKLLAALQRNYGRAAEEASTTAVAASDRLAVEWENLQEIVGRALLPAVTDLSNRLSDWAGDAEIQRRIQERVNRAVETGERVVRGFAGGLDLARKVTQPLVNALGGVENTVKAITLLWVAFKVKAVASFAATAVASALTARKMIADAAIAGRAWDVATRPRTIVVTPTGAPIPGAGRIPGVGGGVILTAAAILTYLGIRSGQKRAFSDQEFARLMQAAQAGLLPPEEVDKLRGFLTAQQYAELHNAAMIGSGRARTGPGGPGGLTKPDATTTEPAKPSKSKPGRRAEADIQLDIARATATADTSDDLRYLRELRAFYNSKIQALEARKNLTAEQKEELRRLYGQLASTQSEIDSIESEGEARLAAQREEAARKLEEQREREEQRIRRLREQAARAAERRRELFAQAELGRHGWTREGMRRAALRGLRGSPPAGVTAGGVSRDEIRRMFEREAFAFLQSLQGVTNQFGSNIGGDFSVIGAPAGGAAEVQSVVQTSLLREQNRILADLAAGARIPASRYAYRNLTAAWDGFSF